MTPEIVGEQLEDLTMRASYRHSRRAISLLLVVGALAPACSPRNLVFCTIRDIASTDPDEAKALDPNGSGWTRHARVCDMGEYLVVTPPESGAKPIVVVRKASPPKTLFAVTEKATNLFDEDRTRGLRGLTVQVMPDITALFNVNGKGANLMLRHNAIDLMDSDGERVLFRVTNGQSPDLVSYSSQSSQGAWIENVDFGPDGEIDLRHTSVSGRPQKSEFRIGNRWLERVKRDGQTGVLLDGRFVSVAEARAKLGVKPETAR